MAAELGTGLQVVLVAATRTVWSGEASMVIARTVDGDLGVLQGHAPMLALLTDAAIEINAPEGVVHAAVDGGFISVADDRVSILTEHALLAEEIRIDVDLGMGDGRATVWTCDLSHDYVSINADYRS